MAIINIGILAHVDAGKTSLTERILFETNVIQTIGSVDKGTTQTDTMELERARGITIKSAVVSFQLNDLKINLVDTPGHPDFVAEVERSLVVLDAVVLVISAVEGVQPQTRRLARAIRGARLPMLIYVNKIDRIGARDLALLADIRAKLGLRLVQMSSPVNIGGRAAAVSICDWKEPAWRSELVDTLADANDAVIEEFDRSDGDPGDAFLETELREQIATGEIVPTYFGSAMTGAGVSELLAGIEQWLPTASEDLDNPAAATIFKIARRPTGEKVVYVRLAHGSLSVRDHVPIHRRDAIGELAPIEGRITAIDRFESGSVVSVGSASAGDIVGLHGLADARIGDRIGVECDDRESSGAFQLPALESVISPRDPAQVTRLRVALEHLAEQDPLISLRHRNDAGELSVRLFGEVQKEVISDTLRNEFGVEVAFGPSQTICIERLAGKGEYAEFIGDADNPYFATVGLRVEPAERGAGIRYERDLGALPLAFYRAIEETIHETLTQGLCGWEVTDCVLTLTEKGLVPNSTAADYRKLTPLVLISALRLAGTTVCEPIEELHLDIPEDTYGAVCGALIGARAIIRSTWPEGPTLHITCEAPVKELRNIEQQLPGLTRGEGGWSSTFAGYVPVSGEPPTRTRIGPNPLNRAQYLAEVERM